MSEERHQHGSELTTARAAPGSHDVTVLLVSDQTADVALIGGVIKDIGFAIRLVRAVNGPDGYERACALQPDLVLIDVKTTGLEGIETARRLKADPATAAILVIAILARKTADARVEAIEAGCNGFLTRPINVDRLRDLVRTHLLK